MGDIGKRSAMDEGGIAFERLHDIGHEGVLEEHRHGAVGLHVARVHGLLVASLSDDDVAEPLRQIAEILGQTEDRHYFRSDRDVEAVFAREAVADATERGDDRAHGTVVHIHDAAPADAADVDIERIAPVDVIVDERSQKIVGRGDGVEIAGEVEVDVLHWHHLGIAAAGRAALHAEAGAQARLAQADHRPFADAVEPVAQPHRRRRLAFARGRWRDRRDEDELAALPRVELLEVVERNLRLVGPVVEESLAGNVELRRDVLDGAHGCVSGDLDVALH